MMKSLSWVMFLALLGVAGCAGPATEEAAAYDALKPRPQTEAQKQTLERLRAANPQHTDNHAGASTPPR